MEPIFFSTEDLICDESFQRYARGESEADRLRWEAHVRNNPHQIQEVSEALRVIDLLGGRQGNLQQQLASLKESLNRYDHLRTSLPVTTRKTISRKTLVRYATGIAASVLIVVGLLYLKNDRSLPAHKVSPQLVYTSGAEPRKTIVLPDNSVVTLRNNSTLTLAEGFLTNKRELTLSGEGFFDVTHDSKHPFVVHTSQVNIEVLGTVFNVRAYPGNHHTETALFRGKVAISAKDHPDQTVILTPSKKIVIGDDLYRTPKPEPVALTADPVDHKAKEIAWIRNRLKIDDEPLSAIAAKLQSWYGISITFEDNDVKAYRYSGTFESETVLKALEALQLSYPFTFRVEKEQIIIGK